MRRPAAPLAGTLAFACTAALLSACGKPPSHAECDALLDHYVELLVSSDRPGTNAGELHKLQIHLAPEGRERSRVRSDAVSAYRGARSRSP